jgi:hypothetical protein
MNTDLLPFSAFAPEPCAGVAAVAGDGQTLTLQLGVGRSRLGDEPIAGTISTRGSRTVSPDALHAGVVAADGSPVTITY